MPAYWIYFSYVGIRWLKRYSVTGPLALFEEVERMVYHMMVAPVFVVHVVVKSKSN